MLKVFLVEDEFVVREGIKNNIDWASHRYEFCGEASDGELAFPMIQKQKPDIVITDIRMPFMDGLALSRLIKRELPRTEIIILTGYEEFAYAKEAIEIGVAKYLLKPISGEELLREMDTLALRIEEKRQEQAVREQYLREMEENTLKEKKELFRCLVTGDKSMPELLEMAERLRLDLSSMWYNIVLVIVQSTQHAHHEYSNRLIEAEAQLKKLEDEMQVLSFDRSPEGRALLFQGDSREEVEALQKEYLTRMQELLEACRHIRYFGGVGTPVNRLGEVPVSFEHASHTFAHRYLVTDSLIFYNDETEQGFPIEEDLDLGKINPNQIDRHKIMEFLKLGDAQEAIYFVDEFFKDIGRNVISSNIFRQYIAMDIYFCVGEFLEGLHLDREQIEPPNPATGVLQSEESTISYMTAILEKAIGLREQAANDRYRDVVNEVVAYIEENYAQENISLNLVASHVNFSPNHLSMVFSQQTGQSFIKFLTDYRMTKAKELLRCTGERSSAISLKVGYKDPHYFSYLFKKTQGMTPTQYRSGKTEKGVRSNEE